MSDLLELAARCEAATGPSRGIDYKLSCWFNPDWGIPSYTSSLDAAMTLVPERWVWMTQSQGEVSGTPLAAVWTHGGQPSFRCEAATPALALCAAALKARSANAS